MSDQIQVKTTEQLISRLFPAMNPQNDAEIEAWEEKQREKAKAEAYRKQAPERYWKESLVTFRTDTEERRKEQETVKEYMAALQRGAFRTLIMIGAPGTGKTHLSLGLVRELSGTYRLASAVVEEIRLAKSFSSRVTEAEILDFYGRANLLVIDEIGRAINAADEQYMIYQVINERYNRRMPTVLISNQTKRDFLNYVGTAAADRLVESAQVLEFTGPSFRAEIRNNGGTE